MNSFLNVRIVLGILITFLMSSAAMAQDAGAYLRVTQHLIDLINTQNHQGIQTNFNRTMAAALPLVKTTAFFTSVHQQFGAIQKLGEPRNVDGWTVFPAQCEKGSIDIHIALDNRSQIAGLTIKPRASEPAVATNKTPLALPFKDRWLVFWGGRTAAQNAHHEVPNQRFALDLIGVGSDGKTQRGDGSRNEDYYAFGREILAPADGTVIGVIEGVPDNVPGSMNPYSAVGNCVMIQHSEKEVSVLAHFKQGSITVKVGDRVKTGQLLGLCGNSGNSSEPHLHYHLQDSPILQDGRSIEPRFREAVVGEGGKSETRANYSPVKDTIIAPAK